MGPNGETLSEEERRAIEVHKWFLSQRAGRDVGWAFAVEDWRKHHQSEWRQSIRRFQLLCNTEQAKMIREYVTSKTEEGGGELSANAEEEWVTLYASEWRQNAEQKMRKNVEQIEEIKLEAESGVYGQPSGAVWRHITVINEKGLHVRPSMCLKKLLDSYPDVEVYVQNVGTNGGAIRITEMMDILSLGAIYGDILLFGVRGERGEELLNEIERLFRELAERPF